MYHSPADTSPLITTQTNLGPLALSNWWLVGATFVQDRHEGLMLKGSFQRKMNYCYTMCEKWQLTSIDWENSQHFAMPSLVSLWNVTEEQTDDVSLHRSG